MLEVATSIFQAKYPEVKVTVIDGIKLTDQEYADEAERVATELMAGTGPDVFLIHKQWDMDKMIDRGVFADLSQFYEESECFKSDNWENQILEGGCRDGYRFAIPVEYGIPLLKTSKETLEKSGINIENLEDFQGFMDETTAYMERAQEGEPRLFRMEEVPMACMSWSGYNFIDWETQTADLASEDAKRFFEWYKMVEQQYEEDSYTYAYGYSLGAASVRDGAAVFDNEKERFPFDSAMQISRLISSYDEPVLLPVRNQTGGIDAFVNSFIAIRGNSRNQLNAWRFIEIYMSTEVQTSVAAFARGGFKVNKEAQLYQFEYRNNYSYGQEYDGFPAECPAFTRDEYENLMEYTEEIDHVIYIPQWRVMLQELMLPYLRGRAPMRRQQSRQSGRWSCICRSKLDV